MSTTHRIESTALEIGRRIREARVGAEMKLADLARRTGLSEGFLSKLERGQASSSIANLIQITDVLGLGLDELFKDESAAPAKTQVAVHRKAKRGDLIEVASTGYRWRHLAGGAPLDRMEVFHLVFPSRNRMEAVVSHAGQEHCYVLSGEILFQVGQVEHRLKAGEGIFIDSSLPHRAENIGAGEAHVLMTVAKPVDGGGGSQALSDWWRLPDTGSGGLGDQQTKANNTEEM
jgi:transcriptional regulator with XRE-family HTH domain